MWDNLLFPKCSLSLSNTVYRHTSMSLESWHHNHLLIASFCSWIQNEIKYIIRKYFAFLYYADIHQTLLFLLPCLHNRNERRSIVDIGWYVSIVWHGNIEWRSVSSRKCKLWLGNNFWQDYQYTCSSKHFVLPKYKWYASVYFLAAK